MDQAPRVWFLNRQASFLQETRVLVGRAAGKTDVVVSSDVDILVPPMTVIPHETGMEEEVQTMAKEVEMSTTDEEEDGWGFEDEEESEKQDHMAEEEPEPDAWKWEDDEEPVENTVKFPSVSSGAFPYRISRVPDDLMEIIQRILDEGVQLQSDQFLAT
jgi:hypothetical protein